MSMVLSAIADTFIVSELLVKKYLRGELLPLFFYAIMGREATTTHG